MCSHAATAPGPVLVVAIFMQGCCLGRCVPLRTKFDSSPGLGLDTVCLPQALKLDHVQQYAEHHLKHRRYSWLHIYSIIFQFVEVLITLLVSVVLSRAVVLDLLVLACS